MKTLELTGKYGKGNFIIVDDEDFEKLNKHKWNFHNGKRIRTQIKKEGKIHYVEITRLILDLESDLKIKIKHKNGNIFDCRKDNLQTNFRKQIKQPKEYKIIVSLQGDEFLVDNEDFDLFKNFLFRTNNKGYCTTNKLYTNEQGIKKQKTLSLHRMIWTNYMGEDLEKMDVDHINMNIKDNRKSNLRWATRSQNKINVRLTSSNKTGFKGVSFCNKRNKYRATMSREGKYYNLGYYKTPEEAALAVDNKIKKIDGEFANLNFKEKDEKNVSNI